MKNKVRFFIILYLRNALYTVLLLLCMNFGVSAQAVKGRNWFTIRINFMEMKEGTASLRWPDSLGNFCVLKAEVIKAHCTFEGAVKQPTLASLTVNRKKNEAIDSDSSNIFIEPGNAVIEIQEKDWSTKVVRGASTQHMYQELETRKAKYKKVQDSLLLNIRALEYVERAGNTTVDKSKLELDYSNLKIMQTKAQNLDLSFVRSHPESFISPYLLLQYMQKVSIDSIAKLYDMLSKEVKNSTPGKRVQQMVEAEESVKPGKNAPDFRATDIDNKAISLSTLRQGKIVILDFWASWCKPCRELTPFIKATQEKFSNVEIEVVGVSLDFDQNSWKKAIGQDSVSGWYHIYGDLKNAGAPGNILTDYNVQAIPDIFVLDREGVIAARFKGSEIIAGLEKVLADLIANRASKL